MLLSFRANTFGARTFTPVWGRGVGIILLVCIRAALEQALRTVAPDLATMYENASFVAVPGTPYQRAWLRLARPDNLVYGKAWRELGFFQVDLCYPLDAGMKDVSARAKLMRDTFYRGAVFSACGFNVVVEKTPAILPERREVDRVVVPLRIRFFVNGLI